MADMVERAAKAHYERLHYTAWENLTPSTRAGFIGAMRAAIEALREPTEAMRDAANRASPIDVLPDDPGGPLDCWEAMIDAILDEEEGNEPHFKALEWFRVKGRGWLAMVECDRERPRDGSDLKGSIVQIDGERFEVVGIDRQMPAYPIRQGERIGLLVSPKEKGNG